MKAQIFSTKVNGLFGNDQAIYNENSPDTNYGFVDIHQNLNMKVPIPENLEAKLHIVFTAPDTWNERENVWSWYGLLGSTNADPAKVIARGLYTTGVVNARVPITLQAVYHVPKSDSAQVVHIRPQWAVSKGKVWLGAFSHTILAVTATYFDQFEDQLKLG